MKKIIPLVLMLLLVIPCIKVGASTGTYSIDEVYIDATINKDGTIDVVERSVYNFDGSFNGIFRDLKLKSDISYDINEVKVVDSTGKEYIATKSALEEDNNYQIIKDNDKNQIKLFSKSKQEPKTFIIKYRINNALRNYEGNNVLNWDFYTVENVDKITKGTLTLGLNKQSLSEKNSSYKLFMDGDWETSYKDNKIFLEFGNLTSRLGVQATLSKDYFTTTFKTATEDGMNINDEKNSKTGYIPIVILVAFISVVIVGIKLALGYSKKVEKYRSEYVFDLECNYDAPPKDISPALVNLIYTEGIVGAEMISSTLFYLANKGYFTIVEKQSNAFEKSKKYLIFKRNNSIEYINEEHLKFLINWFMSYGQDGEFSLEEITDKLKNTEMAIEYSKKEKEWIKILKEDGNLLNMFIKIGHKEQLTNEFYNERLKWISYKKFIEKNIEIFPEILTNEESGEIINYALALGVDYVELKDSAERLSKIALKNSCDLRANYYYFAFYPMYLLRMTSINNNAYSNGYSTSAGGGFSGVSGGGGFSGGGGGGGGAF